jgi:hypothetical protein
MSYIFRSAHIQSPLKAQDWILYPRIDRASFGEHIARHCEGVEAISTLSDQTRSVADNADSL